MHKVTTTPLSYWPANKDIVTYASILVYLIVIYIGPLTSKHVKITFTVLHSYLAA